MISLVLIMSLMSVFNIDAADNCQHFTHNHWHWFHYDEWLYQGHRLIGGLHYNYYHNTTHGDFLQKRCGT
jgi:hypothetical protein